MQTSTYINIVTYYAMLYRLCSCMYYKEINSTSFKASIQIHYICYMHFLYNFVSFIE